MLHIGICDDEQGCIDGVLHDLHAVFKESSRWDVHTFQSGDELMNWYEQGNHLDLLFLDMCMGEKDEGLHAARRLRQIDREVAIVFLTSYNEFSRQGYEVKAFRYLLKGEDPNAIRDCLYAYFAENETVEIRKKDTTVCLKVNKIIYAEAQNKKVKLVTTTGAYEYYHAFSKVAEELEQAGFIQTHRSYLVNLVHIHCVDRSTDEVLMYPDDFRIPISRTYKKDFVKRYLDYRARG